MDLTKADLRPYVDYEVSGVMPIKGKFGFRVTLIYEDLSKRECQHSGFLKKAEAEKAMDCVIAQLHDKRYVAHRNVKVEEQLKNWLEYEMRPRQGFTANSYATYKNCIEKHINPSIGKLKLQALNQGHIMKMFNHLVKKYPSMLKVAKPVLNTAIEFAVSKNLVTQNPCEGITLPKGTKKNDYHVLVVNETRTYNLEQVKQLLKASKNTKIHMQLVFALLMGLRRGEINGLKYSDVDFERHKLRIDRQLGEDLHADPDSIAPNTKSKQEIPPKTQSSCRELDIPDYVYQAILEERSKYEKNRSRRQKGRWVFQDLDYICCSSYGRPRSKHYHFVHYKKLLEDLGLPHIRFHDLRSTYATLLMKNDVNQKAVASALGHSSSIITVDVYTDKQVIIEDGAEEIQSFIDEVHPYDEEDARRLKNIFGIDLDLET